jgi:predicted Na+-dependent transporter
MTFQSMFSPVRALQQRLAAFETAMSRRANTLIFLVVRFVLMSAMVVGFTWYCLELSP